jgi:hypothetical protein
MHAGEPRRSQEAGPTQSRSERVERVGRSQHFVLALRNQRVEPSPNGIRTT